MRYITILSLLIFISCSKSSYHRIKGEVDDVGNMTSLSYISLEEVNLDGYKNMQEIPLKNGRFNVKLKEHTSPNFYKLKYLNEEIVLSIENNKTIEVKIAKNEDDFLVTIKGSKSSEKIQELRNSIKDLEKTLYNLYNDTVFLPRKELEFQEHQFLHSLLKHKEKVKEQIRANPRSTVAYYALFQEVLNIPIFDIANKDDFHYYSMVAASMNTFYPQSRWTKYLSDLVVKAKRKERTEKIKEIFSMNTIGLIDICLKNEQEEELCLSSLKGQVVLLEFHCCYQFNSFLYQKRLHQLYSQYSPHNFQIYSVSYDEDKVAWKKAAQSFPWHTVYDENYLDSKTLNLYNVINFPLFYLINKEGDVVFRTEELNESIEKELLKLLTYE